MKLLAGLALVPLGIGAAFVLAPPSTAQPPRAAIDGAAAFAQCRACHTLNKGGRNGVGPNLNGMFARPSGAVQGFNYSAGMRSANLRWDDRTLNAFLEAPRRVVPGTRMPIGVPDPARRAAIIAYLKAETAK